MIVYDLQCRTGGHRFEGWFKSSDDHAAQEARGLVICPHCGSSEVVKAVQAPRLARKGNQMPQAQGRPESLPTPVTPPAATPAVKADLEAKPSVPSAPLPPQAVEVLQKLVKMQAEALKSSRFVGDNFADDARAMHYGEKEPEVIHGQTTIDEAKELIEEGIGIVPLPFPVVPPEKAN